MISYISAMDMKTMRISFCKKSGLNVIEADDKQQIIDILDKSYSINFKTNYFDDS